MESQKSHIWPIPQKQWGIIVTIAVSLAAYGGLVRLYFQTGNLNNVTVPYTLAWYAIAFVAYLGALLWVEWRGHLSLHIIFAGAITFRVLLLLTWPTLSSDVYRYIWDGYVANNGVSPYAYPIDSPALDYLDNPQRAQANHVWMASPYMPAAQLLFAALTWLFPPHPLFFQAAMSLFDLLAGLLLARLLTLARLPTYRSIIYLWNPLVIVEVAHGAHVDAWMIFLMVLALWLTFSPKQSRIYQWLAPIALGLATLTKILPIFLLPVLFWRWRWRQLALFGAVTLGLLAAAGFSAGWGLTGPLDGTGLFGALRIYADKWNFNSGLFHWLEVDILPAWGVIEANRWGKHIVGGVMLLILAGVWLEARRRRSPRALLRLMAWPFIGYILLTPTLHPWYFLILFIFTPFLPPAETESPWRWLAVVPWVYFSGAVALSYVTYLDPLDLREFEWVRKTEWWPTLLLFMLWLILSAANIGRDAELRPEATAQTRETAPSLRPDP
jgi:hypothetical protein